MSKKHLELDAKLILEPYAEGGNDIRVDIHLPDGTHLGAFGVTAPDRPCRISLMNFHIPFWKILETVQSGKKIKQREVEPKKIKRGRVDREGVRANAVRCQKKAKRKG